MKRISDDMLTSFLIDNFTKLQPFDYILIFFFVLVFLVGLYSLINRLYSRIFHSQETLLKLKEQETSAYKHNYELVRSQTFLIQEKLGVVSADYESLKKKYEQINSEKAAIEGFSQHLFRNCLTLKKGLLMAARAEAVSMYFVHTSARLHIYMGVEIEKKFSEAPRSIALYERLGSIQEKFEEPSSALRTWTIKETEEMSKIFVVPDSLKRFDAHAVFGEIKELGDTMGKYLDMFFAEHENKLESKEITPP